jgi:hypothetical protein
MLLAVGVSLSAHCYRVGATCDKNCPISTLWVKMVASMERPVRPAWKQKYRINY